LLGELSDDENNKLVCACSADTAVLLLPSLRLSGTGAVARAVNNRQIEKLAVLLEFGAPVFDKGPVCRNDRPNEPLAAMLRFGNLAHTLWVVVSARLALRLSTKAPVRKLPVGIFREMHGMLKGDKSWKEACAFALHHNPPRRY
jgi:hypothetical protein